MGKIRANNALGTVQGKIGELAFAHRQDGEILVRRAPVRTEPFTEAELKNQNRFARAVLFVKGLKANPDAYAVYKRAAQVRRKRACDLQRELDKGGINSGFVSAFFEGRRDVSLADVEKGQP